MGGPPIFKESEMHTQNNEIQKSPEKSKQTYTTPTLTIHGSVETLTQKTMGNSNGPFLGRQ